jgi:hypothetical protein
MIRRWIQHSDMRVSRGTGIPPLEGDVYFYGESESDSAAIVGGLLLLQGQPATIGMYTFEMVSGESIVYEVDNSGKVVTVNGTGYPNSGSSS